MEEEVKKILDNPLLKKTLKWSRILDVLRDKSLKKLSISSEIFYSIINSFLAEIKEDPSDYFIVLGPSEGKIRITEKHMFDIFFCKKRYGGPSSVYNANLKLFIMNNLIEIIYGL